MTEADDAASRMLAKLKEFASRQLDEEERALLAVLLAPGVASAYSDEDTSGFAMTSWQPAALSSALAEAVRAAGLRVVGLDD